MNPEETHPLDEAINHLDLWIERHRRNSENALIIKKMRDTLVWQKQACENSPTEARTVFPADLGAQFRRVGSFVINNIPMLPDSHRGNVLTSFSVATSSATVTFGGVLLAKNLGSPKARAYSDEWSTVYLTIQASQERPNDVRALIFKNGSANTVERFDRALKAYENVQVRTGERTAAAIEIRTLLDGIKGDLWNKARKSPNENMTWKIMAGRLAKNGLGGTEYHQLLSQEKTHNSLVSSLSTVAKDREGQLAKSIEKIWSQVLDHIFTVIGLIN